MAGIIKERDVVAVAKPRRLRLNWETGGMAAVVVFAGLYGGYAISHIQKTSCTHADIPDVGQRIQKTFCDYGGGIGYDRITRTPPDGKISGSKTIMRLRFGKANFRIHVLNPRDGTRPTFTVWRR